MLQSIEIRPAYGRKYQNKKEFKKDWKNGLDFKMLGGSYFSIRDINRMAKRIETIFIIVDNETIIYLVRYGIVQEI